MTVATKFSSWQKAGKPKPPYQAKSPNLVQLADYCQRTWQMRNLGIYANRPIRGGTAWSSHAFGAAVDLGYTDRGVLEYVILPFLINNSAELGIQRIHDYKLKRYWQAGKGMINKSPGAGSEWIHVETYVDAWHDDRMIEARLSTTSPT